MSFLRRGIKEEEPDLNAIQEETYERLFPKIGRDFVYVEDFKLIIRDIMRIIDPAGLNPVNVDRNTEAKKRALEYKTLLDSGEDGHKKYKDLIKLDDDDE